MKLGRILSRLSVILEAFQASSDECWLGIHVIQSFDLSKKMSELKC